MFSHLAYLACLMTALGCLALIDHRWRLALWDDRAATLKTIAAGVALFLVWDLLGIGLGIFKDGGSPYTLPFLLFGIFPVEELFFLTLLCYQALILYRGARRLWPRT